MDQTERDEERYSELSHWYVGGTLEFAARRIERGAKRWLESRLSTMMKERRVEGDTTQGRIKDGNRSLFYILFVAYVSGCFV